MASFYDIALHQKTVDTTTYSGKPTWVQKEEDLKAVREAKETKQLVSDANAYRADHPESSYGNPMGGGDATPSSFTTGTDADGYTTLTW